MPPVVLAAFRRALKICQLVCLIVVIVYKERKIDREKNQMKVAEEKRTRCKNKKKRRREENDAVTGYKNC